MFDRPSRHSMIVLRNTLLLFVVVGSSGLTAADGRDPLIPVKPRERPSFRSLLTPAEFEQRSAPYAERIEALKAAPHHNAPAFGRSVATMSPDGWAAKNGIHIGDVLTQVADQHLWGDDLPDFGPTTPIKLYVPATDKLRTVRVDAEKMGVWLALYWHPENLLRTKRQGSRWDELVLLGILARGDDPDLAETAFNKAIDAGYRADVLSDQVGAEIALCQNRPGVAAEFASFVNWTSKSESDEIYPLLLYRVAMANFHWQRAQEIAIAGRQQFVTLKPIGPVRLAEIHQARPAADRGVPPPSQLLEQMRRIDLTSRIQGSNTLAIENRQSDLRAGNPLQISIETGHWRSITFETPEPAPNLEFSIRFSGKPTDEILPNNEKWFVVRVRAITPPELEVLDPFFDPQLTMFAINERGMVCVGCGGEYSQVYFTDPTVESLDNREHEFRMLRFGGQVELFLNGHRILYGPVSEAPCPIQFEMTANGTTVDVRSVQLSEYVELP